MKKLLILACALVIATSAFAAGQSKPAKQIKANYSGVVEKYDAATKTLTVQRSDKHGEFVISETSEVLDGKTKADASALTVGRKVDVEFVMDGAKKIAQKVKVSGAAATKSHYPASLARATDTRPRARLRSLPLHYIAAIIATLRGCNFRAARAGVLIRVKSFIRRLSAPGSSVMKKLLILVCTLAIGTAAFAAPAKSAPKAAHFTGTIQKYDPGTHQLTIKHDGRDTVFQISDKSEVLSGKSKADASSLGASVGQAVKVDYVMDGATRAAEKIEVSAAHAMAHAKKK
jgi:phage baseplate assembly protein gpV